MRKGKPVQLDMLAALTMATPYVDTGAPRLADLFCCAGGSGLGYARAGFDVTGVDIEPQPAYPGRFIQADAIEYLIQHGASFDAVHASPPCQAFSVATPTARRIEYEGAEMFAQVREVCDFYSLPLIMENVVQAHQFLDLEQEITCGPCDDWPECDHPMPYSRGNRKPIMLCGTMFPGLKVLRHRYFEVGAIAVPQPDHAPHAGSIANGDYITVAGHGADNAKGNFTVESWQNAMGITHIRDRHALAEALPPAYTTYLGKHLMAWL